MPTSMTFAHQKTDTEQLLAQQFAKGNQEAFEKLVNTHGAFAQQIATLTLSNAEEARDAVQDTLIKAWTHRHSYNSDYPFKTWLYRILMNTCYDKLKKEKLQLRWMKSMQNSESHTSNNFEQKDALKAIRQCSRMLPIKQRMTFILRDIFDLSVDETSQLLQMPKSLIKSNLYHARKTMAVLIQKLEPREEYQ